MVPIGLLVDFWWTFGGLFVDLLWTFCGPVAFSWQYVLLFCGIYVALNVNVVAFQWAPHSGSHVAFRWHTAGIMLT